MAEGMRGEALPGDGHTDIDRHELAGVHITTDGEGGMAAVPSSSPSNLRLNAPFANHDVACDRGEEEQQIPHVGAVEIESTK
ncbi:unnamed protein product [Urochloa humidicola]